jgi:ankyrin repeat protein
MLPTISTIISNKLHLAVNRGNYEAVKTLLEVNKVNPSKLDDGVTPLHIASQKGDEKMVKLLLSYGADPELKSEKNGATPLITALQFGHSKVIEALLEKHPNLIYQKDKNDINPLIFASQEGKLEIVRFLLDKGLDPKLKTITGSTALHLASQRGHLEVVKELVKADPNLVKIKSNHTLTAANIASKHGRHDVLDFLVEFEQNMESRGSKIYNEPSDELRKKPSDAWKLCRENKFEDLKSLIKADRAILFDHKYAKASMALGGSSEKTLFHRLVENGSDEAIEILKENSTNSQFNLKCNIKYKNQSNQILGEVCGITPLYLAVERKRKAMVEYLIENSDVNCVITKKPNNNNSEKKYSFLEVVLKNANCSEGFEILKIVTGDNRIEKKASIFIFRGTEEEKQNQKERIARKFQFYNEEVKALLRERYPIEIAEIEKMSDEKRGPETSPRVGSGALRSSGNGFEI